MGVLGVVVEFTPILPALAGKPASCGVLPPSRGKGARFFSLGGKGCWFSYTCGGCYLARGSLQLLRSFAGSGAAVFSSAGVRPRASCPRAGRFRAGFGLLDEVDDESTVSTLLA